MKYLPILNKERGFTLIELLVVVAVLSVLMALSGIAFVNVQNTAKKQENIVRIKQIEQSLQEYHLDFGVYPEASNSSGDNSATLFNALYRGYAPDGTPPQAKGSVKNYAEYLDPDLANSNVDSSGNILDPFDQPYYYLDRASNEGTNNPDFDLWSSGKDEVNDYNNSGFNDDARNW